MSRHTPTREELELNHLREREQQLSKRARESAANQERLVKERRERELTMPPLEEVRERLRRNEQEAKVSRGEAKNRKLDQTRDLLLIALLVTATCALIWWGVQLMRGG